MENNKNLSICCGGTKNFSHPELTAWLIKERFEQAKRIGADVLVTDCTLCYSIYSILKDLYSIDVRHYSSLVAEAMGIEKRTDRYQELFHKSKEEILSEIKQKKVFIGKMNIDDINSQIDLFIFFANKLKEVAY
jgi:heterodisulfide reductase subunit B